MSKNSKLCKYIRQHPDNWEELLSNEPFYIETVHSGPLCLFKYNHYASDFAIPEVQEARGIIINTENLEVVCWPFRKFGNYGESYADKIDWDTARVTEKIDGSIIKVWFNTLTDSWQVSTDSIIDANNASCRDFSNGGQFVSFREIFDRAADGVLDYSRLEKNKTYIFELVSPANTVVVHYDKYEIYHTGTRNNITGVETIEDIGVQHPKSYDLHCLDDCIKFAKSLPDDSITSCEYLNVRFEGVVVNDASFNRVKIKSYKYVMAHSMACDHISKTDILHLILSGEAEETASYFPASRDKILLYLNRFNILIDRYGQMYKQANEMFEKCGEDRKVFAKEWSSTVKDSYGFYAIFGLTPLEHIQKMAEGVLIKKLDSLNTESCTSRKAD